MSKKISKNYTFYFECDIIYKWKKVWWYLSIILSVNFEKFIEFFKNFANDNVWLIIIVTIILPFIEAVIPILPLIAIVSFSIASLGSVYGSFIGAILGILFSIIGSAIGMFTVFILIRNLIGNWFRRKTKDMVRISKAINWMENRSNTFMIMFLSNPYVPTSIFNYAMALTGYSVKKYLIIVLVSRTICILLLGILGVVFNVGEDLKAIIWVFLTYIIVYVIIWGVKKMLSKNKDKKMVNNERKENHEKNN